MNLKSLMIIILFYVGWFGCVLLAKTSYSEAALIFPLLLIAFLYLGHQLSRNSFFLAGLISLAGLLFDSLLVNLKFVLIENQTGWLVPLWLISIWLLFSYSMIGLGPLFRGPTWMASLMGFVFGPFSYKSGEAFKVLSFLTPWTFLIYACFWALAFPHVLKLSKRFA